MNKQILIQSPTCIGIIKEAQCKNSIYLNTVYDSAIVEIDCVTKSVKYSLSDLISIEIAELSKDPYTHDYFGRAFLMQFLSKNFRDLFNELQTRKDGVPPTLLSDLEQDMRLVA